MLTNDEIGQVLEVLSNILATQDGRNWFLTVFSGPDFLRALNDIAGPACADQQLAAAAIQVCIEREWLDKPKSSWMERLLVAIENVNGAGGVGIVANISNIVTRIRAEINVRDEIWFRHWVRNGIPFVDRQPFREKVRDLARVDGRPILRIEGESNTGKSYSAELLQYVSQQSGWSFRVVPIEIEDGAQFAMNSVYLARLIVSEMGEYPALSETGHPDTDEDDIPILASWIWRVACKTKTKQWILLDGFRFVPSRNSAHTLIQALAEKIARGGYRQWLRLILIDYDMPLARVDEESCVAVDRPDPSMADAAAIEECLKQYYGQPGATDPDLEVKAQAIAAALPQNGDYFVMLNKLLKAAVRHA